MKPLFFIFQNQWYVDARHSTSVVKSLVCRLHHKRSMHIKKIGLLSVKTKVLFLLAGAEGLEPSARGFGDHCSTN